MGDERAEQYGTAVDDPLVDAAVSAIAGLAESERDKVVRALACAVATYARTGGVAGLEQFARDFAATVRVRSTYADALAATPTRPTGRGNSVREVFAGLRRQSFPA